MTKSSVIPPHSPVHPPDGETNTAIQESSREFHHWSIHRHQSCHLTQAGHYSWHDGSHEYVAHDCSSGSSFCQSSTASEKETCILLISIRKMIYFIFTIANGSAIWISVELSWKQETWDLPRKSYHLGLQVSASSIDCDFDIVHWFVFHLAPSYRIVSLKLGCSRTWKDSHQTLSPRLSRRSSSCSGSSTSRIDGVRPGWSSE